MVKDRADIDAMVSRVCSELEVLVGMLAELGPNSPGDLAERIVSVERAGRLADAARVVAAAPLVRDPGAAEHLGYSSSVSGVATLARIGERSARARLQLAGAITGDVSASGAPVAARHEYVASALAEGSLGVEAASVVVRELEAVACRLPEPTRRAAEELMVTLACGLEPVSVDYLTGEIRQVIATLDPDGALPREELAAQQRTFRVGKQKPSGLVPLGGDVLPEVASALLQLMEAQRRSPRFVPADAFVTDDNRTTAQRCHDALAEIVIAAAQGAPRLNGRQVSVLVTVTADDLHRPDGLDSDPIGTMTGSHYPVSRARVERFIDSGGYRDVTLTPDGGIIGIGSPERCFTTPQIMAIAARDGEKCFTPGCTSPHIALQVHHVTPWRDNGPTHTSNGILLCYWHHQQVDTGPWQYRMLNGLPEARGPGMPNWHRPQTPHALAA